MITEKDIRRLKAITSRKFFWSINLGIPAMVIFYTVVALICFRQADRLSRLEGGSLGTVWHSWIAGVDVQRSYSGLEVKSVERLTSGILYLTVAYVLFAPMIVFANLRIRHAGRLLDFIETHGKQPSPESVN